MNEREFRYKWAHLPTGEFGERTVKARDERHFVEILMAWNAQPSNRDWLYAPVHATALDARLSTAC